MSLHLAFFSPAFFTPHAPLLSAPPSARPLAAQPRRVPRRPARFDMALARAYEFLTKLETRVRSLGLAGLLSYGITNIAYYSVAFSFFWLKSGLGRDPTSLAKAWAITWAGSQVTKPLRLLIAVGMAPFVANALKLFGAKQNTAPERETQDGTGARAPQPEERTSETP